AAPSLPGPYPPIGKSFDTDAIARSNENVSLAAASADENVTPNPATPIGPTRASVQNASFVIRLAGRVSRLFASKYDAFPLDAWKNTPFAQKFCTVAPPPVGFAGGRYFG